MMQKIINTFFGNTVLGALLLSSMIATAKAAIPLWTFDPITSTNIILPYNGVALVQYKITNQSRRTHNLIMNPIRGVTQITTGQGVCGAVFSLRNKEFCTLSLQIAGSQLNSPITAGPIVCQEGNPNQCYRPGAANMLHIIPAPPITNALISVTKSPLTMTINGPTGQLIINNNSTDVTATNISSSFAGTALNGQVTETGNTCNSVAPGNSCILTYLPGNNVVPPTNFSIQGTNTNILTATIDIQGGGVIACMGGGALNLIAAPANNGLVSAWGGAGTITHAQNDLNGAANTTTIVNMLGNNNGIPYAAQICAELEVDAQGNTPCQTGVCYNNWFLPAKDQLACLFTNRATIGGFGVGFYWTSTESSTTPANLSWIQNFSSGSQNTDNKFNNAQVRCVRSF
ncbi:hypothetical protein ACD661_15035 [Legionella lytica]|uniref:NHL repeat protein n=1 Tax=Legionella lytica TaxID=96232 RepID=A0ABW8DEE0_9GAMM